MTSPLLGAPPVCPICSTPHQACTPSNPLHVVDVPTRTKEPAVAELYVYEVPMRNGTTTMKLTEEHAKERYGDAAKRVGEARKVERQPVSSPVHATNASNVVERPELPEDEAEGSDYRLAGVPVTTSEADKLVSSSTVKGDVEPEGKKAPAPQNKSRTRRG